MYKLIIVDDEAVVLRELSNFDWGKLGIELIGVYDNALHAYEATLNNSPDFVLTDITMPIMDGLTLIQQVRKTRPETAFVVLSGFSEYEYMRESMNLGVNDYILKPIDRPKIETAFVEVIKKYQTQKEKLSEQEKQLQHLKSTLETYRGRFFIKLFTKPISVDELSEKCDLCEINLNAGPIDLCLFRFDRLCKLSFNRTAKYTDMLYFVCKSVFSFLDEREMGFSFYDSKSDCFAVALIPSSPTKQDCEQVIEQIKNYIYSLGTVFEDSVSAVYVRNVDEPCELWQYIEQMKSGFDDTAEEQTVEYGTPILRQNVQSGTAIEQEMPVKGSIRNDIVKKMMEFVESNYDKPIRLKDVAAHVYISHTYAGQIFSSVTGKHFVEYLIGLRMHKAKQLLTDTDLPINLIGEKISYADPSYFCQVFKREVGMSPREYRLNKGM